MGSELEALAEISVKIDDESLPQPDGAVARVSVDRRYFDPQDIAIAIEVSDRSTRSDMAKKTVLYAEAGIPELWIVDLRSTQLHQFWFVRDGAYRETNASFLLGELSSATVPGLQIDGSGIL
jgi:Uma2 family endonuclease